ncbi:MAG: hypothetical protein FJW37_14675 [Acidobacteria bacterium]|nr:hypothetical protein [Acidobacteriota bacterium]
MARAAAGLTAAGEAQSSILRFLESARQPALLEPGEDVLELTGANHALELREARLVLEAWTERRSLARRILRVVEQQPGRLELKVERFPRREGSLFLIDLGRPAGQALERRGARMIFRERFRQMLSRHFPGWSLAELTTEPDLEHSLSPAYPRALLRSGSRQCAAIAAPRGSDTDGVLTFGLIWLDYLRRRERQSGVEALAVFAPIGHQLTTALRLRCLDPAAARFHLFAYSREDFAAPVDLADAGNLKTKLRPARSTAMLQDAAGPEALLESQVRAAIETLDPRLVPEPVYRQTPAIAGAERGILDLLAIDRDGRLAVLELKASADIHLPLQALDYWVRVKWHLERGDFARNGYFPNLPVRREDPRLLLISPALEFHSSTGGILRFFAPDLDVESIGLGLEWQRGIQILFRRSKAR